MVIVMPSQQRQGEERCHRWQRKLRHTECNKASGCASLIDRDHQKLSSISQSVNFKRLNIKQPVVLHFWFNQVFLVRSNSRHKKEKPKLKELVTYNHRYEAHVEENNAVSD